MTQIIRWDFCAEMIRVARLAGAEGAGLLVEFSDPLRAEELPKLAAAIGKKVLLIRHHPASCPWRDVWINEAE